MDSEPLELGAHFFVLAEIEAQEVGQAPFEVARPFGGLPHDPFSQFFVFDGAQLRNSKTRWRVLGVGVGGVDLLGCFVLGRLEERDDFVLSRGVDGRTPET